MTFAAEHKDFNLYIGGKNGKDPPVALRNDMTIGALPPANPQLSGILTHKAQEFCTNLWVLSFRN